MQWESKSKRYPEVGDTRIKKRFLLFPKSINGITKWLEVASWMQEYKAWYRMEYQEIIGMVEVPKNYWTDIEWVENK